MNAVLRNKLQKQLNKIRGALIEYNKILDSSDDTTIAPAKFDSLEATLWDVDDALKFLESRTERDEI